MFNSAFDTASFAAGQLRRYTRYMSMRHLAVILCLVGVIQIAIGQTSASNNQSVRIPMAGFLTRSTPTSEEKVAVPQMLTFPTRYVEQKVSSQGRTVLIVGLPEDIEKVSKNLTISEIK